MKKALLVLALPVLFSLVAQAADEAAIYKRWKLDFTRGDMAWVAVKDALGQQHVSWYLTFTLKNSMDRDVPLNIRVKAGTDTGQDYRGSIAPYFQKALEAKTGKKYKTALDLSKGTLAAGESVDGVVFFGEIDPNMDLLTVKVYGLYDDVEQIEGKLFVEVKVLVMMWFRPGDEFGSLNDEMEFKKNEWVTEGERKEIPQKVPYAKEQAPEGNG
jgi:hypothetical protein